jgi:hypothetical protein
MGLFHFMDAFTFGDKPASIILSSICSDQPHARRRAMKIYSTFNYTLNLIFSLPDKEIIKKLGVMYMKETINLIKNTAKLEPVGSHLICVIRTSFRNRLKKL